MLWLAIVVLLIFGFAIPGIGRAIRRLSIGIAALCGLGFLLLWAWMRKDDNNAESTQRSREFALADAVKRIRPNQVVISSARLEDSNPWKFSARVKNGASKHTVRWVSFQITVGACAEAESQQNGFHSPIPSASLAGSCDTLGSITQRVNITVPPGQARDISRYLDFPDPPVFHGHMQWTYKVVEVGADISPQTR